VNGEAIESWERSKRGKRQAGEGSSLDSDPVRSPNWRVRRRVYGDGLKGKRRLEEEEEEAGGSPNKRSKKTTHPILSSDPDDAQDEEYHQPLPSRFYTDGPPNFAVEIRRRPGFDPSEYTRFTSSQLSSNNGSAAAVLPSSQVVDSNSQDSRAKVSQTTIPDSQEFSVPVLPAHTRLDDVLPGTQSERQLDTGPLDNSAIGFPASAASACQDPAQLIPFSIRASERESPAIPSHQPASLALAHTAGPQSQSLRGLQPEQLQNRVNGRECSDGSPEKSESVALRNSQSRSCTLDFLTQPDFRFGYSSVADSPIRKSPEKASVYESGTGISNTPESAARQTDRATNIGSGPVVVSAELLHSAQIIPSLSASPGELEYRVGDQLRSATNGDEHEVIPQTAEHEPAERPTSPLSISAADSESQEGSSVEEGVTDSLVSEKGRHRSYSSRTCGAATPSHAAKSPDRNSADSSSTDPNAMSALDELRQLQAEVFGEPAIADINPALEELTQAQERALDQEMVSPSAILSSIEGDGVTTSPQMPGDAAKAGSVVWPPERLAALDDSINPSGVPITAQEADVSSTNQRISAVEELRRGLGLGIEFPAHTSPTDEQTHAAQDSHVAPSATIEPSALVTSTDFLAIPTTSLPISDTEAVEGVLVEDDAAEVESPSVGTYDLPQNDVGDALEDLVMPIAAAANEHIVTLPLAANARQLYADLIKEHRPIIEEFSSAFTNDVASVPSAIARAGVDLMFEKLLDLCDLPAYADSIPDMSEADMMKHATNSNSKFSFLYEFLEDIRNVDGRLLVLSKPGRVADYVKAVVASTGLELRRLNDGTRQQGKDPTSPLNIVLGDTNMSMSDLPDDVDVVIGFDQESRSSSLFKRYLSLSAFANSPTVLSLVAAQTLEHLDLRFSRAMDVMERKNALVISVFQSIPYLLEPGRGYPEPDELALIFGSQIKEPRDDFLWDPQPIPDDIFEVYLSSQAQLRSTQESTAQQEAEVAKPNGRKRHLVWFSLSDRHGVPRKKKPGLTT